MRHRKNIGSIAGLALLTLFIGVQRLNDGPAMTPAQHRVDPPMRMMYRQASTTLRTMGEFIQDTNAAFDAKASQIGGEGAMVFIYEGADGTPDTKFTLKIGMKVGAKQPPLEGFEIAELPRFESISSVYCGPMSGIKDAYGQLFRELSEMGYEPTGISRETYLHFEDPESENDITLISVEVKPKV